MKKSRRIGKLTAIACVTAAVLAGCGAKEAGQASLPGSGQDALFADADSERQTASLLRTEAETMPAETEAQATDSPRAETTAKPAETKPQGVYIQNFDIYGKWRSVGKEGFGQAQPGAVVLFDGQRCNFLSPADTYGLFEKNGRQYLAVSGLMGGNLTFKITTLDENHILLDNGRIVTELKRLK